MLSFIIEFVLLRCRLPFMPRDAAAIADADFCRAMLMLPPCSMLISSFFAAMPLLLHTPYALLR